jgi:hypothetical protein
MTDPTLVDWLEVAWLASSSATLALAGLNAALAARDWHGVRRAGQNGALRLWATGMLVLTVVFALKGGLAVVAGVASLLVPNAPPPGWGLPALVRAALVAMNALMLVAAAALLLLRHRLRAYRGG